MTLSSVAKSIPGYGYFLYLYALWDDCYAELELNGAAYWLDRARFAELLWFAAFTYLIARLTVVMWRGVGDPQKRFLTQMSQQSLNVFVFVSIAKALFPFMWRFHESCFLDKYTALVSVAASAMLSMIAGREPPSDQFLELDPRLPVWWRPHNRWTLCVLAFVLAVPLDICRPVALKRADRQNGMWPFACDFLDMLDSLAILPQFAKFQRTRKKSESQDAGQGHVVSDILGTYMAILACARFFSFLSGVFNVTENLLVGERETGPFLDTMELFYCFCSGVNLALLAHFLYHYVMSIYRGKESLVLPTLCTPALQDKISL